MRFNWFYVLVAVVFLAMLFVSFRYFRGSRSSTVGVTYAREFKVNSEKAAFVSSIDVVPGQQVKKGDLLVELSSAELELEIEKIVSRINVLKSEKYEKAKRHNTTLQLLKADHSLEIEQLRSEIAQMENEIRLNKSLMKQFARDSSSNQVNSSDLKLRSLKQQEARQSQTVEVKVEDMLEQHQLDQKLLQNQIVLLENELALINREKAALSKFATEDGVIADIYVRRGEQVEAFTPLVSIDAVHPSTVVAYQIGEKNNLSVGGTVQVMSYGRRNILVEGKIVGFGAVVQLPEILQKATAIKAFGREVFIDIDENNELATGEKVLVR